MIDPKRETEEPTSDSKHSIRCSNCRCLMAPDEFICPVCGKIYWKNASIYFQNNPKLQKIVKFSALGVLAILLVSIGTVVSVCMPKALLSTGNQPNKITAVSESLSDALPIEFGVEYFTMPDVLGLSEEQARQALECMGLQVETQTITQTGIANGCVAEQNIRPYSAINRGDTVCLSIAQNSGTNGGIVPDFTGMDYKQAVETAAKNNVTLVVDQKIFKDISAETQVISQDVNVGDQVENEQSIGITIALKTHEFRMPELEGVEEEDAKQIMENLGVTLDVSYATNLDMTNGLAFYQDHTSGDILIPGDNVTIKVTQNQQVEVPLVIGMSRNDAVALLEGTGLTIAIEYTSDSTLERDYVVSQSIPGHTRITIGAGDETITLLINDPKPIDISVELPNVVGTDVSNAKTMLQNRGFSVDVVYQKDSALAGTVICQSPAAGTLHSIDSVRVTLVVSDGPGSSSSSSPSSSTVSAEGSTSSTDASSDPLGGLPPEDSTDPRDIAIRTLMLGGVPRSEIDAGLWDKEIEIFISSFR